MTARLLRSLIIATALMLTLSACSDDVGDVSLGLFTTKDVKIEAMRDPVVTGVTCHISHIKADLNFADPSDMGIACRQTGPITADMIDGIDHSKSGEVVFRTSKSILLKTLKVRRIYDPEHRTLMYLSYSTKEIEGSHRHSLSTVPLWGSRAWADLEQQAKVEADKIAP